MVIGEGFQGLGESRCHSYLQEGQEGGSKEPQAAQTHFSPWESDGATNPGSQTYYRRRQ